MSDALSGKNNSHVCLKTSFQTLIKQKKLFHWNRAVTYRLCTLFPNSLVELLLHANVQQTWRQIHQWCLHCTISITGRFYYSVMTNLLRNESITWQFYSLLCDVVRISEVSYLNFLWLFIIVYCLLYLTKTMFGSIVLLLSTLITCKMCVIDLDILYHTCSIVVCAHKNGVSKWRPNKPNYVVKIIWCFAIQLHFLYILLSNPLAFSFSFASSNLDGI